MFIFMAHKPRLTPETEHLFEVINYVLLVIFVFEAVAKILCMEWNYFKDPYNVFDFGIISITLGSLIISATKIIDLGSGNKSTSILRVFRLGRVLRLVNKAEQLRMIFNTFLITLPSLGSIGLLLLLIQFIYTILGVEMFAMLKRGDWIDENANFENFMRSFMTLFRVSTGEGWNFIEDEMVR